MDLDGIWVGLGGLGWTLGRHDWTLIGLGRTWVYLGGLGRTWVDLGRLGRTWADLGALGWTWADLGWTQADLGRLVHLSPVMSTQSPPKST